MERIKYNLDEQNGIMELKIFNSFRFGKKDFKKILLKIKRDNPESKLFRKRKIWFMVFEWATHNLGYKWKIQRERTKDVDLEHPQKWYYKVLYFFGGLLSWLIIQ